MKTKLFYGFGVAVLVLVLFVGWMLPGAQPVSGAPAAIPTPLAASAARSSTSPTVVTFFNARVLTADTTSPCIDLSRYEKADFYYNIDHGTPNTTTLTLRFGNSPAALVDGINLVAASATDGSALNQFQVFGATTCVLANVATGSSITITVNALVK